MAYKIDELIGKEFNYLTILRENGRHRSPNGNIRKLVEVRCRCGTIKTISLLKVISKRTISCGCYIKDINALKNPADRPSRSKEHSSWASAKDRCFNPSSKDYARYGGAGITMSDDWKNSFSKFLEDMGPRPTPKHSLDRKNGKLGYCRENCRWATPKEQHRNISSNRMIEYKGEIRCLAEWCEVLGLKAKVIADRIYRGTTFEEAIAIPILAKQRRVIDNKTGVIYESIKEAAITFGYNSGTLFQWLSGKRKNLTTLSYYNED